MAYGVPWRLPLPPHHGQLTGLAAPSWVVRTVPVPRQGGQAVRSPASATYPIPGGGTDVSERSVPIRPAVGSAGLSVGR